MAHNSDLMDTKFDRYHHNSDLFLDLKMDLTPTLYTPSPKMGGNAVIFSVYFCGKYFGELGLFEPDLLILDWIRFKSYIFSSLNIEGYDAYQLSYSNEDGSKIPIETEEDYQEALKMAKVKAEEEDKLSIFVVRSGGVLPRTLRSFMSSSLLRGSSFSSKSTPLLPQKEKKTNETSDQVLKMDKTNDNSGIHEFQPTLESCTDAVQNSETVHGGESYDYLEDLPQALDEAETWVYSTSYPTANDDWETEKEPADDTPKWFVRYMKEFREDFSQEVSAKIDDRFEQMGGKLSANELDSRIKDVLSGHNGSTFQRPENLPELKGDLWKSMGESPGMLFRDNVGNLENGFLSGGVPEMGLGTFDYGCPDTQDYFLKKLLKREQEILDFLDNTNERIKEKIQISNEYADSLRGCLSSNLPCDARERVLNLIENFKQRQNRTTEDIKILQNSMNVKKEEGSAFGLSSSLLRETSSQVAFDAKFVADESFPDGTEILPLQRFRKVWAVRNTGSQQWDNQTFLICQAYLHMEPLQDKVLCPPLLPGELGRVVAVFESPVRPGLHTTEWRFVREGHFFGNHLWCSVIVPPMNDCPQVLDVAPTDIIQETNEIKPENGVHNPEDGILSLRNPKQNELDDLLNIGPGTYLDEDECSEELCALQCKDVLNRMNSKQVLRFLLYVIRICQPDIHSFKGSSEYKTFCDCVLNGKNLDFNELRQVTDGMFLRSCARRGLASEDMIKLYERLFRADDFESENAEMSYLNQLNVQTQPTEINEMSLANELNQAMALPDSSPSPDNVALKNGVSLIQNHEGFTNVKENCETSVDQYLKNNGSVKESETLGDTEVNESTEVSSADESSLSDSSSSLSEQEVEDDLNESESDCPEGSHPVIERVLNQEESRASTSPSERNLVSNLHKTFKENVRVDLDFEVIPTQQKPKPPVALLSTSSNAMPKDPLTFQEKHFTLSHRPPPEPVRVPDSDDESVSGLVFIKDTEVSSVPSTGPCSPDAPIRSNLLDRAELSVSCSSFSECDDDGETSDASAMIEQEEESVSVGPDEQPSTSSVSSVVVDEASSTCFESTISDDEFDKIDVIQSSDQLSQDELVSSDELPVAESGSSTTPTSNTVKDDLIAPQETASTNRHTDPRSEGSRNVEDSSTYDSAYEESKG